MLTFPHSRTTDPLSSFTAGDNHARQAESNRARILQFMQGRPPMTSKEIAFAIGMERHEVARRLPELAKANKVTRKVPEHGEILWEVAQFKETLF